MPFKAIIRSIVLIPFIVPTVLSAIAFWWEGDAEARFHSRNRRFDWLAASMALSRR